MCGPCFLYCKVMIDVFRRNAPAHEVKEMINLPWRIPGGALHRKACRAKRVASRCSSPRAGRRKPCTGEDGVPSGFFSRAVLPEERVRRPLISGSASLCRPSFYQRFRLEQHHIAEPDDVPVLELDMKGGIFWNEGSSGATASFRLANASYTSGAGPGALENEQGLLFKRLAGDSYSMIEGGQRCRSGTLRQIRQHPHHYNDQTSGGRSHRF